MKLLGKERSTKSVNTENDTIIILKQRRLSVIVLEVE